MIVTQITELSKSRSKVYLDQEFAFVLYKGEMRSYQIYEGKELLEKDYQTIMQEVLPKRAKLRSMNLLKSREYTEEQLRRKLQEGFYPEEVIEEAIQYVASYRYIDDMRYAVNYITCYEKNKGRKRIEQELFDKGVSKEIIEKAWAEWEENGGKQEEQEMIKAVLKKKHYIPSAADSKERQRMYAYLIRRGYSAEEVRKAICCLEE